MAFGIIEVGDAAAGFFIHNPDTTSSRTAAVIQRMGWGRMRDGD